MQIDLQDCAGMDRASILRTYIQALNDQFSTWVSEQLNNEKDNLWIEGAQDYIKHAKKLQEDFEDVSPSRAVPARAPPATSSTVGLPSSVPATRSQPPSFLNAWGASAEPVAQSSSPFTGLPAASEAPKPFNGFNFPVSKSGIWDAGPKSGSGGAGASWPLASHADGREAGPSSKNDEDEEAPASFKPEVKVGEDSELLFKSAAALHVQTPTADKVKKDWAAKGTGTWTLRRPLGKGGRGKPCYMVFTTEAGRVLVNASAYKGLKIQPRGDSRVMMSLVLEANQAPSVVLVNLRDQSNAQTFKQLLEANLPQ